MLGNRLTKSTLRTRLVMAGVFVGALLALSLSVAFSWGDGIMGGAGGGRADESDEAKAAFHAAAGSCINWVQPDASDIHLVPCEQAHLFEVTGVVNIADKYPPGVGVPDVEQWRQIALERCGDGTETYLGHRLDPFGRLTVSALRPGNDEWSDGDRQLRCVLQWAGPGGGLQQLHGPAKDQQQAAVWDPGTCLALVGKTVGDPIDCGRPHAYEIVATLDLHSKFTTGYPSQNDQTLWLDLACTDAVKNYSGGADLASKRLILTWDLREQESWDAGSTLVNCKVGAKLLDNSGLDSVTGSIKKPAEPADTGQTGTDGGPAQDGPAPSGGG